MLVSAVEKEPHDYGNHYLPSTDNALSVTPISGLSITKFFQIVDTDPWAKIVAKQTAHSRFNCTISQRVSRLVRETLSFSKKLENHIGAIWYFIHHYNELLRL